jgi:hypothetical protein
LFIDDATTYALGDTGPGGGIVFYLTPGTNGTQGLEAAPVDQSSGIEWGCINRAVGGTTYAIGTGLANTNAIINECGTGTAAGIAASYISPTGYSGWYLPSINELNQLYNSHTVIPASNIYWSSTEGYTSSFAWSQYMDNEQSGSSLRDYQLFVRAVRPF